MRQEVIGLGEPAKYGIEHTSACQAMHEIHRRFVR
jgi:hypothetical protein